MIVETVERSIVDSKIITKIIENAIEDKKCVEIYLPNDEMLYILKEDEKKYTYGYYRNNDNEEWRANIVDCYDFNLSIDFTLETYYHEVKTFDISNCTKLYIGNEWSN